MPTTPAAPQMPIDMGKPSQPKVDWTLLAKMALETGMLNTVPTNPVPQQPDFSVRVTPQDGVRPEPTPWKNMGYQVLGGVGGGLLGGLMGGPVGAAAGAAMGTTLMSNEVVQPREVAQGTREGVNPLVGAVQGAGSMLPAGSVGAGRILPQLPKLAALGAAGNAATSPFLQMAETGTVSLPQVGLDAAIGAVAGPVIGGGGAALARGVQALPRVATRVAQMPAVQRLAGDETGAIGPLNKDLQGAKPRYNIGAQVYQPTFASPVDLAAYIVTQKTPSKRDADYLAYAMRETGLDEAGVRALGQRVRAAVKAQAQQAQGGSQKKPAALRVAQVWQEDGSILAPEAALPKVKGTRLAQAVAADAPPVVAPVATPRQEAPAAQIGKPVDLENAPASIPPRNKPSNADTNEDVERTTRRLMRLGIEEDEARAWGWVTAQPEPREFRRMGMTWDEVRARASEITPALPKRGELQNVENQGALATYAAAKIVRNEKVGADLKDLNALTEAYNAGDAGARARIAELEQKYEVQGPVGLKRLKLQAAYEAAEAAIADEAQGSETGRALNFRKALLKARKLDDASFLQKAYELGLPKEEAMDALQDLAGKPREQFEYLRKLTRPSGQQWWRAYLMQAYLSNPVTHGVNITSNFLNYALNEVDSAVVTGADRVRSAVTGAPRTAMQPPRELLSRAYAEGLKKGFSQFAHVFKHGYTEDAIINMDLPPEVLRGSWLTKALEVSGVQGETADNIGRASVNWQGRLLAGTDATFQMMGAYPELYRRATAKAWNEGLRGQDLIEAIEREVRDADWDDGIAKEARKYGAGITFQEEAGDVQKALNNFLQKVDDLTVKGADALADPGTKTRKFLKVAEYPFATAIIPFRRTPANIFKQAIKRVGGSMVSVPVKRAAHGLGLKKVAPDTAQDIRDVVQSAVGLSVLGGLYMMTLDGTIQFTTTPPENDFEREQFYAPKAQGKQPWGIVVGGRTFPLSTFGSLGTGLAILATMADAAKEDPKRPKDLFSDYAAPLMKVVLDSTMLKGASDLMRSLTDPRQQDMTIGRFVAGTLPMAAGQRLTRDLVDPILRDPGGDASVRRFEGSPLQGVAPIIEEVEAATPFLSKNVRPRLNAYGEPIEKASTTKRITGSVGANEDYVGAQLLALKESLPDMGRRDEGVYPTELTRAFSTFETSLEDKLNRSLAQRGVDIKTNGVPVRFSDEQRQRYMELVGGSVHDALSAFIRPDNAKWGAMSPEQKKKAVERLKKVGKQIGERIFLESLGDAQEPQ